MNYAKPPMFGHFKIPASLKIGPDFQSFQFTLSQQGSFGVEGPYGLNSYFTAPAGTTNVQLAALFATHLNTVPGYDAAAIGSTVNFNLSSTDDLLITVNGAPLEYALTNVPEPAGALLIALGIAPWLIVARRNRI